MTYCGKAKTLKYVIKKFVIIDNLKLCQARQVTEVGQDTKLSQVPQERQVTEVGQDTQETQDTQVSQVTEVGQDTQAIQDTGASQVPK